MKKISVAARWILLAGSVSLMFACSSMSAQHDQSASAPTPVASLSAPMPPPPAQNPEDKMPRIDPAEAKQQLDAGKAIIIDVRGPDAYKLAHIKGSIEHSLSRLEAKDFEGLPKNKQIIAYCT